MLRLGFLDRFAIEPNGFSGPNPDPLLSLFKAKRISDSSSCTLPPCLAIVADMFNTYKKLVAASNNEMRLLPQPYMHL